MNNILAYFAVKYEGDFEKIITAIKYLERVDIDEVNQVVNNLDCKFTTLLSKDYPLILKNLNRPPFVLFYEGDLSLINEKSIAVIGSRYNSKYGEEMTNQIIKDISKENYVIISGLAKGIDSIAHQAALENNTKTIAVLGNGINYYYPNKNKEIQKKIKEEGLVISEYPPNTKPKKEYFPLRNRIIACLADAILVVEAKKQSGTMITINEGLNLGKDILCVPTKANENSGCNYLIKQGAFLVENAKDIIEILENR